MISCKIICCNCFFHLCLVEINGDPRLLDIASEENLITFLRMRDKWWSSSSDNAWYLENWSNFYDNRIFHACHKCIFDALFFTKFRRYYFVHTILSTNGSHLLTTANVFDYPSLKNCLQKHELNFKYWTLVNFWHSCQLNLCFKIINNEFNCLDTTFVIKSEILNKVKFYCLLLAL